MVISKTSFPQLALSLKEAHRALKLRTTTHGLRLQYLGFLYLSNLALRNEDSQICSSISELQAIARARRYRIDLYSALSPTVDQLRALRSVPALLLPVELDGIERPTVDSLGG